MGNVEVHDLSPVRDDEKKVLNLSRSINYRQYCRHVEGHPIEGCLTEIPWTLRDSLSLFEHLRASFNALTELPSELPLRLPHLNFIDLSHNQIEALPDNFGLFFHLKTLIVSYNKIKCLPESFFHLSKLDKIDLSHNSLKYLPSEFSNLECLSKLNVSSNKLKTLPNSLGGMRTLTVLLAIDNRLQEPPQALCDSGSDTLIAHLRKNYKLSRHHTDQMSSNVNIFPRVRGNNVHSSVLNPHSAQVQYIQSQTHTDNVACRIKTPLLPPPGGSSLDSDLLRDRIVGLVYGAAIGDAIGLATCCMSLDRCHFCYNTDMITYPDIIQDELRVRWKQGDWTSNFDTMVLVLDSLLGWGGVVDELEYARRLKAWIQHGFPELGDKEGIVLSETVKQVTEHREFAQSPHTAASQTLHKNGSLVHVYSVENGVIHSEDDSSSSVSSDQSSISEHLNGHGILFPSSHPCIPAKKFGTDNGAIVQTAILGVPYFHMPSEVETNTIRICRATHCHPLCVASCVVITQLVACMLQGKHDNNCYKNIDEMIQRALSVASKHLSDRDHIEDFNKYSQCVGVSSIDTKEQYNMSNTLKAMASGLAALRSQQSFKSYMMTLILEGGDSNSNGCVAGALLGCKYGYSRLPQEWVQGLRKKQTAWLNVKINLLLDMIGLP